MGILDEKYPVRAIVAAVILFIGYNTLKNYYYLNDSILTIGVIYDEYGANGIPYIKFKYKVTDKWYYKEAGSKDRKSKDIYYYVKYSKEKPEISQILLDEPVRDSIKIKASDFESQ
ncbi:hypothetical protein [Cytophaga sp. FL35]|uniref:hypothetical protein n=1 Tax=Cytophaga sp. FL35 TaxID=1904456 RepID=UPI00165380DF|nr:hypothetical protein [Cytophaga sp. FL35]MBC7000305.1 hypothetical protein [Cytophaga sp. FL35]